MTRGPKSGGKGGGLGTGDANARASSPRSSKTSAGSSRTSSGKPHVSKPPVAKTSVTKTSVTNSPATKTPVTTTPVTENPVSKKPPVARPDTAKTDSRRNGGDKSSSPSGNCHGETQAAQPDGTSGNARRKANRRGAARLAAVQALYQMDMTGAGLNEILAQFESHWLGREVEGEQYLPAEAAFFRDIVSGVVDVQRDLDPRIDAALEATWPLKRIEAILRSVLRAGAYELQKRTDVPARVVVSEYVDVAHAFVDKTETGMVNAVLDRLARNVRAAEFG
jgi:transcription antitermination protein NusB